MSIIFIKENISPVMLFGFGWPHNQGRSAENQLYTREFTLVALQWRSNGRNGVSNHQPRDGLLNRLFRCRSKITSKLRVTGLCVGNSPVTGEFPAQRASNAENVSIWWRHPRVYVCYTHISTYISMWAYMYMHACLLVYPYIYIYLYI